MEIKQITHPCPVDGASLPTVQKTMKNNTVTLECLALLHICKWWINCYCYYRCFVETEGGAKLIHEDHMLYGTVQLPCIPPDLFVYITRSWWVQSLLTLAIWLCYLYCTLYPVPSVTFTKHMLGPWGSWKYCACEYCVLYNDTTTLSPSLHLVPFLPTIHNTKLSTCTCTLAYSNPRNKRTSHSLLLTHQPSCIQDIYYIQQQYIFTT